MEKDYLDMLVHVVLPSQILDYFTIVGIEQTSTEICIGLDEKMQPGIQSDVHFESKGFMDAVSVTDFPIRDHKVILRIRRRRWVDLRTGKSFRIPIDLDIVAKGTRYYMVAVVARISHLPIWCQLQKIDEELRHTVTEVTLDLSDSMRKIVRTTFPKASRVIGRFHIQKLA